MKSCKSFQAVIYARVSSKEQEEEGFSIDSQIKLLKSYAKDNNLEIVREFVGAESAKDIGRDKFNQMLNFLKANPLVRYLLCEKTDRLSRNLGDIVTLDRLIKGHELVLVLVKENIVLTKESRSNDTFMFGIMALVAKNQTDRLSEEVKKGLLEKAEQGRRPVGRIPFGYLIDKNTNTINIDPPRAPLVREMFTRYAENKVSLKSLAAWARTNSITRHKSNRPLTASQIERILKNEFYTGNFRFKGKLYKGIHEPIISQALFDATQQAFKNHNKPQYAKREFAFGSLMTCAKCGCKITAQEKKRRFIYYNCTGMRGNDHRIYLTESHIAAEFRRYLGPIMLTPDQAKAIFEKLTELCKRQANEQSHEQVRLTSRLSQLEKWLEQSYLDKLEGKISEDQWQSFTANGMRKPKVSAI